jgi:hypothetical protein
MCVFWGELPMVVPASISLSRRELERFSTNQQRPPALPLSNDLQEEKRIKGGEDEVYLLP